jgi:hypothetical protein
MPGRYLGTLVVIELTSAALVSWLIGVPSKLPGVALDSALLFGAYRALIMFLALYVVTVIIIWSFTGSLATHVGTSGIAWAGKDGAKTARDQMLKLNLRLDDQQSFIHNVMLRLIEDKSRGDEQARTLRRIDGELQQVSIQVSQMARPRE